MEIFYHLEPKILTIFSKLLNLNIVVLEVAGEIGNLC